MQAVIEYFETEVVVHNQQGEDIDCEGDLHKALAGFEDVLEDRHDSKNLEIVDNFRALQEVMDAVQDGDFKVQGTGPFQLVDESGYAVDAPEIVRYKLELHQFCEEVHRRDFERFVILLAHEKQFSDVKDLPEFAHKIVFGRRIAFHDGVEEEIKKIQQTLQNERVVHGY